LRDWCRRRHRIREPRTSRRSSARPYYDCDTATPKIWNKSFEIGIPTTNVKPQGTC
jgi:hypothetical protein